MSKYHVKRVVLVTVILGLLTSVGLWFAMQQRVRPASRQTIILLHGYGSSGRATTALATAIQTQTHLKRRQQVNVSPQGMVKLSGTTHQLQQGGIYQLNFINKQTTAQQASATLARLLQTFKERHVNQVVLVGHSMGATAALRVLLSHPIQDTTYPTVTHLVTIAAPFNSGLGSGGFDHAFDRNTIDSATKRPRLQDASYRYFDQRRANMPEQTKILNVMGDIGDGSDGVVTNFSSAALKFWLKEGQIYQSVTISGPKTQHSQVRDNPTVTQQVAQFIVD
ncbi:alpha/beta fold hydrolase [Leuconostoc lactis]|uniref:alpha/beta fold hydrolase n=1 Tax=Leuconostoc lactis TaxID=1246 RepID=UPI0021BEEF17|nr:alpha/beta fold hydrolase [Leuconostoc lactis]MCT8387738.1 alpha/beta fold hydrolase [Leuconostoc lactis]